MTLLAELDDADLSGYATHTDLPDVVQQMTAPLGDISIESTGVALGLVALHGADVLGRVSVIRPHLGRLCQS